MSKPSATSDPRSASLAARSGLIEAPRNRTAPDVSTDRARGRHTGPVADGWHDSLDPFDTAAAVDTLGRNFRFIERVADASPVLIYVFDLVRDRIEYCNRALTSILGYTPDDLRRMDFSLMRTLIHPEDKALVPLVLNQIAAASDDDVIEYEYRLRHASGDWRWLAAREIVFLRDATGTPRQVLGSVMDVTDRKFAELALRESQQRYELAATAGRVAVWDCDLERGQQWTEPTLAELLDLTPGDLRSGADWSACIHPEDRERVRQHRSRVYAPDAPRDADGNTPCPEIEYRIVSRHGQAYWLADRGTIMRRHNGQPYRAVGTITDITERKRVEDELHKVTREILRAQDAERRRIAGDLHDGVAQDLAAIAINLLLIDQQAQELPAAARSVLAATQELAERSLRGLRTLSYLLHPPLLEHAGLAIAIRDYAQGFARRTGIAVDVSAVSAIGPLPQDAEMALYRVVQECLVNVQRHSGSESAEIRLTVDEAGMLLEVRDHGHGMASGHPGDGGAATNGIGVGIASMHERVRHLGGQLTIHSGTAGTTVSARLPMPAAAAGRGTP